jgi:hypothetical protein
MSGHPGGLNRRHRSSFRTLGSSAPVAAHGVVLLLWVAEVRAVGGQPQSLRMAVPLFLVAGGWVGWWSAPVAAHGGSSLLGGRRVGRLVVSPSRCAWRFLSSWWPAGGSAGSQPQSLRMAVPLFLVAGGWVGWWSAPVAAHFGTSLLRFPLLRADRDMRLRASHLDSGASSL